MATNEVVWRLERATAAKHRLYQAYLNAWWPVLLQPSYNGRSWQHVTYLDAFAGPGVYQDGEPGSPVLALRDLLQHTARDRMNLSRDRVRLAFIEKDQRRVQRLREELTKHFGDHTQLPVDARAIEGDASTDVLPTLDALSAWGGPILAIFDSWGNVNIPLTTIQRIAQNRASEVIVTFGSNWFTRRENLEPAELDAVFGGRSYWEPSLDTTPEERWHVWVRAYHDALRRAGFKHTLQFEVRPRTGQPLYLVYGTNHVKGLEAMKDAMWKVDSVDGQRFRDPRLKNSAPEGQASLFDPGTHDPELQALIQQRLREGPCIVEVLQEWLLTETSRWRRAHAIPGVTSLREHGLIRTTPPAGRITRATSVQLLKPPSPSHSEAKR